MNVQKTKLMWNTGVKDFVTGCQPRMSLKEYEYLAKLLTRAPSCEKAHQRMMGWWPYGRRYPICDRQFISVPKVTIKCPLIVYCQWWHIRPYKKKHLTS